MFDAVVFDMDGVIFDSEKLYRKHWKITGEEIGISSIEMDEVCNLLAGATKEVNGIMMKKRYGEDFDYLEVRRRTMVRLDADIEENGLELKPGVIEIFEYIKSRNMKMALATSTHIDRATMHLREAGLYDYFDELVFGNMVEHGKPAPDIYIQACERLRVEPCKTIGIEDSINGVISCHGAGLYTVMVVDLVPPTKLIREEIADKVLDNLYQVIDLIK